MAREDERRGAFEELFAAHYWAVRGYVLRRDASAVEDAVAETFLVAWRHVDSLDDDPLPWLLGVARRVLANQQRAERRRTALTARLQSVISGQVPDWEPPSAMSEDLAAAMVRLSSHEREALLLVAWEGLEPARAARAAGCSPSAFRVRLHRARRNVAAALTDSATAPRSAIPGDAR